MTLFFPCRPARVPTPLGQPDRAAACRCQDHQLVLEDTCYWCGHYPPEVIAETWAVRAAAVFGADRHLVAA